MEPSRPPGGAPSTATPRKAAFESKLNQDADADAGAGAGADADAGLGAPPDEEAEPTALGEDDPANGDMDYEGLFNANGDLRMTRVEDTKAIFDNDAEEDGHWALPAFEKLLRAGNPELTDDEVQAAFAVRCVHVRAWSVESRCHLGCHCTGLMVGVTALD